MPRIFDSFSEFLIVDQCFVTGFLSIFMQIHFLLSFPYTFYKRWKKLLIVFLDFFFFF